MSVETELDALTQSYLDGTIGGGEVERLNAILDEDEVARRRFAEALNLDSAIAATAAGWKLEEPEETKPVRLRLPIRLLILAACLVLFLGGAWWWQSTATPFATVAKGVGVEDLPVGTELRGDTHTVKEGTVELLTARGARVVIEAPAKFRFESAQRLHMLRGRLAADVPPSAKGFTVVTPTGDAVDLGTRFGIDVPVSGDAQIHVFEGEVIAKGAGGQEDKSLYAGDAWTMSEDSSTARALRSSAFIQLEEMQDLTAGQQHRSKAGLETLREDSSLITLLDFESGEDYPGKYRMVQGRWPGSRAPEFIDGGDHLKLDVDASSAWAQITFAAWVRLDHLGAPYQSLLHADGWDNGKNGLVHWMVNEATTMRFAMFGNVLAPGSNEFEAYPDSLTPVLSDQGRWVHLATVYDSETGTVRFYHNGRFDKEVRQSVAHPARLGSIQIGNWNEGERKLSGRVDELIILGRIMSDDEVRILYESGNPYTQ